MWLWMLWWGTWKEECFSMLLLVFLLFVILTSHKYLVWQFFSIYFLFRVTIHPNYDYLRRCWHSLFPLFVAIVSFSRSVQKLFSLPFCFIWKKSSFSLYRDISICEILSSICRFWVKFTYYTETELCKENELNGPMVSLWLCCSAHLRLHSSGISLFLFLLCNGMWTLLKPSTGDTLTKREMLNLIWTAV